MKILQALSLVLFGVAACADRSHQVGQVETVVQAEKQSETESSEVHYSTQGNGSIASQAYDLELGVGQDHFFENTSDAVSLESLGIVDDLVHSPSPFNRPDEILLFAEQDKLPASTEPASKVYYIHENQFKRIGVPIANDSSADKIGRFFIIRKNLSSKRTTISLPLKIRYWGSGDINPAVRPWDEVKKQ